MLKAFFNRLRRSESGSTTVEFMIVMPLIVFWFGGTYTFFHAYSEWTKSVKATYTVADILSRQLEVDNEYIEEMNTLYASIMGESANNTWLRISSLEMTDEGLSIDWTQATGLHTGLASDSEIPTELIPILQEGETIIMVESHIPYVPFQSYIGLEATTLKKMVPISPRFNSKLANTDHEG